MKKLKNFLLISFIFIFSVFFTGCNKQEEPIVFDDEYPLALSPSVEWGVVREPYAAYKVEIGWGSSVAGHCRRGEILQILGITVDENSEKWCKVENGWLPASCMNIYSNRLKAERISELLLKAENKN